MTSSQGSIVLGVRRRGWDVAGARVHEVEYPAGASMNAHRHANPNVTIVLRGRIEETTPAGRVEMSACSVLVKPAGTTHANRVGPEGALTLVTEFVTGCENDARERRASALSRYGVLSDAGVASAGLRLRRALSAQRGATESVTGLLDSITATHAREACEEATSGDWLARAWREVGEGRWDGHSCATIAEAFGVHPASLSRAFRRRFGLSLAAHLRRRRVLGAAALVCERGGSLASAAARGGFADQSHLTRVFREELGMTPARYRDICE